MRPNTKKKATASRICAAFCVFVLLALLVGWIYCINTSQPYDAFESVWWLGIVVIISGWCTATCLACVYCIEEWSSHPLEVIGVLAALTLMVLGLTVIVSLIFSSPIGAWSGGGMIVVGVVSLMLLHQNTRDKSKK